VIIYHDVQTSGRHWIFQDHVHVALQQDQSLGVSSIYRSARKFSASANLFVGDESGCVFDERGHDGIVQLSESYGEISFGGESVYPKKFNLVDDGVCGNGHQTVVGADLLAGRGERAYERHGSRSVLGRETLDAQLLSV